MVINLLKKEKDNEIDNLKNDIQKLKENINILSSDKRNAGKILNVYQLF